MDKMGCQIQILAIDVLDTLFKTNKKISKIDFEKYFEKNAKILDGIMDNLIKISD